MLLNVSNVIAVKCHFCSKPLPTWRVHQLHNAQTICDYCLEWHQKAIQFKDGTGDTLPGCQICGASWEFLRDSTLGVEVRMYVVPKDGIYQIVCATCIGPYVHKRRDLYGGTRFGTEALKL